MTNVAKVARQRLKELIEKNTEGCDVIGVASTPDSVVIKATGPVSLAAINRIASLLMIEPDDVDITCGLNHSVIITINKITIGEV